MPRAFGHNIGVSHRVVACEVPQSLRSPDKPSGLIAVTLETRIKEVISPLAVTQMMARDFSEYQDDTAVLSQNDQRFLTTLREGIKTTQDGHYEMPLPFKSTAPEVPNNKELALRRLGHLKNRLKTVMNLPFTMNVIKKPLRDIKVMMEFYRIIVLLK